MDILLIILTVYIKHYNIMIMPQEQEKNKTTELQEKEDRIKRLEMEVSNLEFQISELRDVIDHLNDRLSN
tara:strand:- start:708 stop:917 length:210 start_codon:yes stop_codon:yes gene_type:complete